MVNAETLAEEKEATPGVFSGLPRAQRHARLRPAGLFLLVFGPPFRVVLGFR